MQTIVTPTDPTEQAFMATLARAKSGSVDARNDLFRQFYPQVRSMVHRSLATDLRNSRPWLTARFSTGDVVQEVFQSVITDLEAFQGQTERAFAGYLSMVIRNRIIDAIRFHEADRRDGRLSAPAPEDGEHESGLDHPSVNAAASEERELLQKALVEFPEQERLLLRARFEGAASFKDLAEQLGYPSESTARRAYFSAQARLAVRLYRLKEEAGQ